MALVGLFLAFFRIGLFAVGGAYSFLPLIEKEVVERYHWLTKEEFLEVLGFVQVFPGAISVKYATYTGYKIAGIPGILVANLANLLTPVFLVLFATVLYMKYKNIAGVKNAFGTIRLVVFAMIIAVAFQLIPLRELASPRNFAVAAAAFILFIYAKIHPAFIIVAAGVLGAFLRGGK